MSNPTEGYRFHHSMIRIKDPEKSVPFYRDGLGMKLIRKFDFEKANFSLLFLAYYDGEVPNEPNMEWIFGERLACVELTHNWGTEKQDGYPYANGNEDVGKGFGHLAIVVPDVYAACERLERMGYNIRRKPGPMMGVVNIAFVEDPDKYWIEIVENKPKNQ
ncbi:beta-lactamase domain-containing proteinoylglutathione lyase [Acrasis kona]|uniref:Aldoketomutase n=1 Tax=Acrasis kona TaxID=1008807 RepID=A0AAW2Z3I6_9EUKA